MARREQTREASGAVADVAAVPALLLGDRLGTQLNEMTQDVGASLPGYSAAAASMAWASSSVSVSRWRGRTVGIAKCITDSTVQHRVWLAASVWCHVVAFRS